MRFIVQSINKIPDVVKDYYEIDLVDDQMNSNWQSAITLRIEKKDVIHYRIGQVFNLNAKVDQNMSPNSSIYFERLDDHVTDEE
jgi:hypothetical protein